MNVAEDQVEESRRSSGFCVEGFLDYDKLYLYLYLHLYLRLYLLERNPVKAASFQGLPRNTWSQGATKVAVIRKPRSLPYVQVHVMLTCDGLQKIGKWN